MKDLYIIDGYNIIFAWEELRELAQDNMDGARGRLMDLLCNYQAIRKCCLMVVFDAYRVAGHATEVSEYHNIQVVYTKEAETADQYIEKPLQRPFPCILQSHASFLQAWRANPCYRCAGCP